MGLMDYVQNTERESDALVRIPTKRLEAVKKVERLVQLFNGTEPVFDEKLVGPDVRAVTWSGIARNARITHAVMKVDGKEQRYEIGPINVVVGDDLTLNL